MRLFFPTTITRPLRGFTLLETLVAVLILVTAISGPLVIAQKGLSVTLIAKDQVTAYFLAQDAVEYIHFKRDNACLTAGGSPCVSATWLSGGLPTALSSCTAATPCQVDSIQDTVCVADSANCPARLNYDAANNFFSLTSGSPSLFTRTVVITTPISGNSDEAQVVATVTWLDVGGKTRSVVTKTNMFNWE